MNALVVASTPDFVIDKPTVEWNDERCVTDFDRLFLSHNCRAWLDRHPQASTKSMDWTGPWPLLVSECLNLVSISKDITVQGWFSDVPVGKAMAEDVFVQAVRERLRASATGRGNVVEGLAASDESLAIESALRTSIEHASARLKRFESYESDWDGEGAPVPDMDAIGAAQSFLRRLQPWHPHPLATLDSEGHPVIEVHDDEADLFGTIRFISSSEVEMLSAAPNVEATFLEGELDSPEVAEFLSNQFQITLRP
jgi:hypothetical protein